MTRPLMSMWSAPSDWDYHDAMGHTDHAPQGPVRADVPPLPGPCVPCAREGRLEVSGRCPIHDGGDPSPTDEE